MTQNILQASLTVTEVQLRFTFPRWIPIPPQPAVTIRGLLGSALINHLHPGFRGSEDQIPQDSPYWPIFKPLSQAPHPWLIECENGAGLARQLAVNIRFFGEGKQWLPLCLDALEENERNGFGPDRAPYVMQAVSLRELEGPWTPAWTAPDARRLRLYLQSPTRLKHEGRLVDARDDFLKVFVHTVVRRLRSVADKYGTQPSIDNDALQVSIREAELTRMAFELCKERRVSSRTGESVTIGGLRGWCEIESPPPLFQVFDTAVCLAVGGKIASGCGRVSYTPISE